MADQTIKKLLFLQGAKATAVKWVYQKDKTTASEAAAEIELQLRRHCELASSDRIVLSDTEGCLLSLTAIVDSIRDGGDPCSEVDNGSLKLKMTVKKEKPARGKASNRGTTPASASVLDAVQDKLFKQAIADTDQYMARYMAKHVPLKAGVEVPEGAEPDPKKPADYDYYNYNMLQAPGMLVYITDNENLWTACLELCIKIIYLKFQVYGMTEHEVRKVLQKKIAQKSRGSCNYHIKHTYKQERSSGVH